MADVTVTSGVTGSVKAEVADDSVIGKSAGAVMHFIADEVPAMMEKTLDQVQIKTLGGQFEFQPSIAVKGGTTKFKVGGGINGELDLVRPDGVGEGGQKLLFPADQFGSEIAMGKHCYLSLCLAMLQDVSAGVPVGAFTLTPSEKTSVGATLYVPFGQDGAGKYPTLKTALGAVCSEFKLPSTIADVRRLPENAVFVFDATGTVGFAAKFNVLAAVNPTASPGISQTEGQISITAGPALTIGGGFKLTGEFSVRIWKKSETVFQLGYYKKQARNWNVSFDASESLNVTLGGFDLVAAIYGLLGDSGKLDAKKLQKDLPESIGKDVEAAYKAAVCTKLSIAIDEQCDTTLTDEVAFAWNFDTSVLTDEGTKLFNSAIEGDLSGLMALTDGGPKLPVGVTKAGSVMDKIKETKHTFTFNFLGLFDYANVNDAVVKLVTKVSEDGQLILTDTAHVARMSATATPMVKADQLRSVFAQDGLATVGYAASLGSLAMTLKVNYSYFEYKSKGQISDLELFVETAAKVGDPGAESDWAQTLRSRVASQQTSLLATLSYDGNKARSLFVRGKSARSNNEFERVGRQAVLATPGLGLNSIFAMALSDDLRWDKIRDVGTEQNFFEAMNLDVNSPPEWAVTAFTYVKHIVQWAAAMNACGKTLLELDAKKDKDFARLRQRFADQLKSGISDAPLFNDSLGLLMIYLAAAPVSKSITIRYAGSSKSYN